MKPEIVKPLNWINGKAKRGRVLRTVATHLLKPVRFEKNSRVVEGAPMGNLSATQIGNCKSAIGNSFAPLAQLVEQVTLNSNKSLCAVFRDVAQRIFHR